MKNEKEYNKLNKDMRHDTEIKNELHQRLTGRL